MNNLKPDRHHYKFAEPSVVLSQSLYLPNLSQAQSCLLFTQCCQWQHCSLFNQYCHWQQRSFFKQSFGLLERTTWLSADSKKTSTL